MPHVERAPDPDETRLFDAIGRGDAAAVRTLVSADPDLLKLRSRRAFDATVVTAAVSAGDLAMVDLLLSLGADINAASTWWAGPWRPIHTCINPARDEMAAALIERGAEVDAHAAAGLGDMDRLRTLLDADPALVHAPGGDGATPLHFARSADVAAFLLERGAEIDARDVDHESTALHWSLAFRAEVGAFLAARGARDDVFLRIRLDDAAGLRTFLDTHPEALAHRTGAGEFTTRVSDAAHMYCYALGFDATPLHAAAATDAGNAATVLLERGMSTDVRGVHDAATPLHWAVWHDATRVARVLLDAGADPDVRSGPKENSPALSWAIVAGAAAAVDLLIDRGATVTDACRDVARRGAQGAFRGYHADRPLDDWSRIAEAVNRVAP